MRIEPFRPLTYGINQITRQTGGAAADQTLSKIGNAIDSATEQATSVLNQASSTSGLATSSLAAPGSAITLGRQVLDTSTDASPHTSFGAQVSSAIKNVDSLQKTADDLAQQVSTGNPEDAHKAVIAMDHALMALDFTLQIRNKVLDAYQEIMKTQL